MTPVGPWSTGAAAMLLEKQKRALDVLAGALVLLLIAISATRGT